MGHSQLSQEKAKPGDHEPKSHQRNAGSNPGEKSSFGGEIDPGIFDPVLCR
jgi:hypothetical protein